MSIGSNVEEAGAAISKKEFIQKLMVPGAPMWQAGMEAADGKPYINLDDATYIIGMIGLNEAVKNITGQAINIDGGMVMS